MRSWCTVMSAREGERSPRPRAWRRAFLGTFLLIGAIALLPRAASAQQAIAGTVIAAGGQEPIAGAQVLLSGTTLRTTSDEQGRFRFTNVSGPGTIEVRRIGYKLARIPARPGDENVRIVLTLNPT